MTELLTKETFLEKVFNYEKNKEWTFEGEVPAIIDFYADWCGPCKMVAPILEDLSEEYGDKLKIYKVDTEKEQELVFKNKAMICRPDFKHVHVWNFEARSLDKVLLVFNNRCFSKSLKKTIWLKDRNMEKHA